MSDGTESELRALCTSFGWSTHGDGKTLVKRIEHQIRGLKAALTTSHRVGQLELSRPPTFFPVLPTMTDEQEARAEEGVCPKCRVKALDHLGTAEGMRFYGCMLCKSMTILAYRGEKIPPK